MSAARRAQVQLYGAPRRTWERDGIDPRGLESWLMRMSGWRPDDPWLSLEARRRRW